MYNTTSKASKSPTDILLSAGSHLGIPQDQIEPPALSGWDRIEAHNNTKEICLVEGAENALNLLCCELPMPILWLPDGDERSERPKWIEAEFDNLKTYETIYLCFDADEEGKKAVAEVSKRLGAGRCRAVSLPYKTAHECLKQNVPEETIRKCFLEAKIIDPSELKRASDYCEAINRAINHITDAERGYALPWDKAFGTINFRPGELTVWTGINGHGKSQLIGYLMLDQIKQGAKVCIASMELSPVKTLMRMMRQASALKAPTYEYIKRICQWWGDKLWLFDLIGTAKSDRLIEVFKYGCQRYGIDVFVIDSLMKCGFADDDYAGQKRFLDQLSDFKNEFNCHVHVVAHPKKAQDENTPPSKLDVKGVSGITDLADNCMTVWRNKPKEDRMTESKSNEFTCEEESSPDCFLKCTKQRFGDWEGSLKLWFDKDSLQYLPRYESKPCNFVK